MSRVIAFPIREPRPKPPRPEPDTVRLGYDFNKWCAEIYAADRLRRRIPFDFLEEARAEVELLEASGLRRLPDAKPDWTAVAYGELSDGSHYDEIDGGGDAA